MGETAGTQRSSRASTPTGERRRTGLGTAGDSPHPMQRRRNLTQLFIMAATSPGLPGRHGTAISIAVFRDVVGGIRRQRMTSGEINVGLAVLGVLLAEPGEELAVMPVAAVASVGVGVVAQVQQATPPPRRVGGGAVRC